MSPASDQIPIERIVEGLSARVLALVGELLPRGRREGREWVIGSLAGEPGRSCKVHLTGHKSGVWSDFSSGETGDALDLVAEVLFRGQKKEAIKWALGWLGLDGGNPAAMETTRRAVEERQADTADDIKARIRSAVGLWHHAQPSLKGTAAERYLRDERGIDLSQLGHQPGALRFHPGLWHPERMNGNRPIAVYPAMVAIVCGPDGAPIGVHRTFLQVHPGGRVTKLQGVKDAKLSKGPIAGGLIRLWRGLREDGKRGHAWSHMPEGEPVAISEGIEDGLSVVVADPSIRVVVGISLGNMTGLKWDERINRITLIGQNDTKQKAIEATDRCLRNWAAQGKLVRRIAPPAGVKDVNDLVRRGS